MPRSKVMGRVHHRKIHLKNPAAPADVYENFDRVDGRHSWQTEVPAGCVMYPVRRLNEGVVTYFNFPLAKEMGLLPADHPHIMNKKLEKKILDTFSIRIINEYDQKQNLRFHPTVMKEHPYMATRYLQLQHKNKAGKTSGDGRSVWNGEIKHRGVTWDISSRGTGVTCLSPGAVQANKPLRSGNTAFGYGCGLADIDELLAWAIMAEVFHNNDVNTERALAIIDLGDGNGIGVRAGKNLVRPAHLFMHLKQSHYENLKQATDFLIRRQYKNGEWTFNETSRRKYDLMLGEISRSFARFAAQLERNYIFAWLDWDGDNVLANAGIIDYGSIRQFGLRHDEYRYDDVDRFSTNLNEQKIKARQTVQVFAQLTDYLNTGVKKPIEVFARHWSLKRFDVNFAKNLLVFFLRQIGIEDARAQDLVTTQSAMVKGLYESYMRLESVKTRRKTEKIADGINRPAILNMRSILFELPRHFQHALAREGRLRPLPAEDFFSRVLAEAARGKDRKLSTSLKRRIEKFQSRYIKFLKTVGALEDSASRLGQMADISYEANRPDRITGDALLHVVDSILKFKRRGGDAREIQGLLDHVILAQSPTSKRSTPSQGERQTPPLKSHALLESLLGLIDGHKESI